MADLKQSKSFVLRKKMDMVMETRHVGEPIDDDVQIEVKSTGICGSDTHYWMEGRCGRFVVEDPIVLGHESSGIVVAIGPKVKHFKIGDRVAIEPGKSCRKCSFCKNGRYNLCPAMEFCATPPIDGTLTQYFNHPEDFCFKLPDQVSYEEGAMIEPLAVAIHSCNRADLTAGDTVLICGAGPIGIMCVLSAKAMGAGKIIITDIDEGRLRKAKRFGADEIYCVGRNESVEESAHNLRAQLGSYPKVVLECSGATSSLQTAIYAAAPGGSIATVGRGLRNMQLPIVEAASKEVDIKGIFRYANCYPIAMEMVSSGKINVRDLVSHRFEFENSIKAFETARSGDALKVMINSNV